MKSFITKNSRSDLKKCITLFRCLICIIPWWLGCWNGKQRVQINGAIGGRKSLLVNSYISQSGWHTFIDMDTSSKTNHLMHQRTHAIPLHADILAKDVHKWTHSLHPSLSVTLAHTLMLWWVKSFAAAVPEEESGSVCPKWLAYLCRKTDSFICLTLSRCFVVVSALIWICKQVNSVSASFSPFSTPHHLIKF